MPVLLSIDKVTVKGQFTVLCLIFPALTTSDEPIVGLFLIAALIFALKTATSSGRHWKFVSFLVFFNTRITILRDCYAPSLAEMLNSSLQSHLLQRAHLPLPWVSRPLSIDTAKSLFQQHDKSGVFPVFA